LGRKSRGRLPVVWLHASGRTAWAVLHTIRRHGGRVEASSWSNWTCWGPGCPTTAASSDTRSTICRRPASPASSTSQRWQGRRRTSSP